MREILFRGKSKAQGSEWLYGDVLIYENSAQIWETINNRKHNSVVALETIGQFTGLTDCNGKKIFEGDIVYDTIDRENALIIFDIGMYYVHNDKMHIRLGVSMSMQVEVIGNIHDNPELLKGE